MFETTRPAESWGITTQREAVMGRVLGLLGVAALCTGAGALIGPRLGPGAFILSIVGSIGTLLVLMFVAREKTPINLWLMYAFATFEGMALGLILDMYLARGLSGVVLNAGATTGAVTLAAGAYGATTKRDLSGLGPILMIGLIAVIVASLAGLFLQLPMLHLVVAAASALLFTGFLVFDLNRVANAAAVTEGQVILLAVSVYLDIFNLFLALLQLFGFFSSED